MNNSLVEIKNIALEYAEQKYLYEKTKPFRMEDYLSQTEDGVYIKYVLSDKKNTIKREYNFRNLANVSNKLFGDTIGNLCVDSKGGFVLKYLDRPRADGYTLNLLDDKEVPYVFAILKAMNGFDLQEDIMMCSIFEKFNNLPDEFFGIGDKESVDLASTTFAKYFPKLIKSNYFLYGYTDPTEIKEWSDCVANFSKKFPEVYKSYKNEMRALRVASQSTSDEQQNALNAIDSMDLN